MRDFKETVAERCHYTTKLKSYIQVKTTAVLLLISAVLSGLAFKNVCSDISLGIDIENDPGYEYESNGYINGSEISVTGIEWFEKLSKNEATLSSAVDAEILTDDNAETKKNTSEEAGPDTDTETETETEIILNEAAAGNDLSVEASVQSVETYNTYSVRDLGEFKFTFYTPYEDEYGYSTCTEVTSKHLQTCAVDPNVIPLGSTIIIYGNNGICLEMLACDIGRAIKNNRVDIFLDGDTASGYDFMEEFGEVQHVYLVEN